MLEEIRHEAAALPTIVIPEAMPAPHFGCDDPFKEAKALKLASPAYPLIAQQMSATGLVRVKISLDEDGRLIGAAVFTSSTNPGLDEAAVAAARRSTYSPETFACKPQAGDYIFTAEFRPR